MARSLRSLSLGGLFTPLLLITALPRTAHAEPAKETPSVARERAAVEYDRAVSAYDRGDYSAATESFLAADASSMSDDAVTNAIAAARRARSRALIEKACARALAREHPAPKLLALARDAMAEGEALPKETSPSAATSTPRVTEIAAAAPPDAATPPTSPVAQSNAPIVPDAPAHAAATWSPSVFYAGAGASAVLLGFTIWSGVDTLNARAVLPGSRADNEDVMTRAHRTDALLAATVVLGGATAYVGLRLVRWHAEPEVRASATAGGATLALRGYF